TADVLHHDVAGSIVLDEVDDLDDVGVFDFGERSAFSEGDRPRALVVGVEETLQDHPPLLDLVVAGEVDPAQPPVREAPDDLVLLTNQVPGRELRCEGERMPALRTEPFGAAGPPSS